MPERALVPDSGRCPGDHRRLTARLQPGPSAQRVGLSDAGGVPGAAGYANLESKQRFPHSHSHGGGELISLNPEHSRLSGLSRRGSSLELKRLTSPICLRHFPIPFAIKAAC